MQRRLSRRRPLVRRRGLRDRRLLVPNYRQPLADGPTRRSTAVVEAGIAGTAPVVGHPLSSFMLSGTEFSASTLALWWTGHAYVLPVCTLIGIALLVRRKAASPWAYAALPVAVIAIAFLIRAPLGLAATSADYGQFNARVSWYTWPLHSMLAAFGRVSVQAAWIGSVGVPGVIAVVLALMPWIGKRASSAVLRSATLFTAAAFAVVGALFGGPAAALTGNRDPAAQPIALQEKAKATDPKTDRDGGSGSSELQPRRLRGLSWHGRAKGSWRAQPDPRVLAPRRPGLVPRADQKSPIG